MKVFGTLVIVLSTSIGHAATLMQCTSASVVSGPHVIIQWRDTFSYEDNLISSDWNPVDISQTPTKHSESFFEDFDLVVETYQNESGAWTKTIYPIDGNLKFEFHSSADSHKMKWGTLIYDADSIRLMCQ